MPEIKRIELERDNDQGVHEVKEGERLEPVEPEPEKGQARKSDEHESGSNETDRRDAETEQLDRATTPFPGG